MNRSITKMPPNKSPGVSNIPLRRTTSKNGSLLPTVKMPTIQLSDDASKWKAKFDDSEKKRKTLVAQHEKSLRVHNDLEKKYTNLQVKQEELETELFEKNESLTKLTTVSKNLFQEYEILKNKYETETEAMNRALNDASQWYKENKMLKRRTLLIDNDTVDEGVDTDESICDNDLENLRESVKQLSQEVAELQAEINSSKLTEFETFELNATLTSELEAERKKCQTLESEIKQLQLNNDQILRVSNIMKRELEELKTMEQKERLNADILRKEAQDYKRERNVLAHQSTLLMQGLDSDIDSMMLLSEIEDLKRLLEEERNRFGSEMVSLQEKLEEQENNSYVEVLEERLKLVESELQHALERAESAEKALKAPPAPPPPPPPPALPIEAPAVPLRHKKISRTSPVDIQCDNNNQEINQNEPKKIMPGVNEDIINQIKGGTFTLRKRKSEEKKKERETPKAVSEMLNILGSLRRVNRNKSRESANIGDVQL